MKARVYTLSVLFVLSMFFTLQVKADDRNNNNDNKNNNNCDNNSSSSSTALPIDGGIAFLAVAGTVVGIVAVKKSRSAANMTALKG